MAKAGGSLTGLRRTAAAGALFLAVSGAITPLGAGVKSTTEFRDYHVAGTSAAGLVNFMKTQPLQGDRGAAVANIRPYYSLSIASKTTPSGVCRATDVNLRIRFVITLPKANNAASLSPGTGAAWTNFVAFARKHEETHRSIYVDCANDFVAQALRLTSTNSCMALEANIRRLLESAKRGCDTRQLAFDAKDYKRVFGLSLFKLAKYPAPTVPKPAKVSATAKVGGSSAIAAPPP